MIEKALNAGAPEAERDVVAGLMVQASIDRDISNRVADLTPAHFGNTKFRTIFSAELDLLQDGILPTKFEVEQHLRRLGRLDAAGGSAFRSQLAEMIPAPLWESYSAAIIEASNKRALARINVDALTALGSGRSSLEVASGEQLAISKFGVSDAIASIGVYDMVSGVHAAADQRIAEGRPLGILTGFAEVDHCTGGMPRSALALIGAPTSHGKTTLALNIAQNTIDMRADTSAALYSLEMSKQAISDRITARRAGISLSRIRDWKCLNEFERREVATARESLVTMNQRFFIADRISSIDDLIADARKRKAASGLDLVVVDYLQLVAGVDEDNRERTVNVIAWKLFEMAKDLNVAVLALSQVTPAAQMRTNGRLSIDDLRDSKAIGHHARLVMMLNRPRQSRKDDESIPKCRAFLQIEKNSEGETGDLELHFDGALQEFREGRCDPSCRYWIGRSAA